MGRKARPRVWRDWYVTEAGGQGMQKLCPVSEGLRQAKKKLEKILEKNEEERREARRLGLVDTDAPYTVAHLAAEFVCWKRNSRTKDTAEFHQKSLVRLVEWFGDEQVRKLKLFDGQKYLASLREDGPANTTINHHIRSAKSVLNYAVENGDLEKTPLVEVGPAPRAETEAGRHRRRVPGVAQGV